MKRFFWLVLLAACHDHPPAHDHSDEHPAGHDHHEEGHGHGDTPTASLTLWSDQLEIFAEHPVAVAAAPVPFLIHVTVLHDFRALEQGTLVLQLQGPAPLRGETSAAVRPGIFTLTVTPAVPGTYTGTLQVTGEVSDTVQGVTLQVHPSPLAAIPHNDEHEDEGLIELLKEQQWRMPFATAFAAEGELVAAVEVSGRVTTPPGGTADVGAPITGRLVEPPGGLPYPGAEVRKGQRLASLLPAPSSPEQAARASLVVAEAQARAAAAAAALARAERLIQDQAISRRELEEAQREARVASEAVQAAQRAAQVYSGGIDAATWHLTAPIGGTLAVVNATPGAVVSPGETLFRVVDMGELWLVARVPEQDAAGLRRDRDAAFRVAGAETWHSIDLTGPDATASLVNVGRVVHEVSRTVDVIYALRAANDALRVGGLVQVSLPSGPDFRGVVVPSGALIDQEGRHAVYVQVDGEHFAERQVRLGPRAGDRVGIVAGLAPGERVVTRGAHLVRLAERASDTQPHGHIH